MTPARAPNERATFGLTELWKTSETLPRLSATQRAAQLVALAWKGMRASPLTALITIATIALSFSLFSAFLLSVENLRDLLSRTQSALTLTVYLKDNATAEDRNTLLKEIRSEPAVAAARYRSKEEALTEFRTTLGSQSAMLQGLETENPLPASIEVRFKRGSSEDVFKGFGNRFASRQGIEEVHYSEAVVTQLTSMLRMFRFGGGITMLFVFLMTGFIIANTIKLAVYAHRDEIEIMYLVGATNSYVRAPYMIEGFIQGLVGGSLSLLVVYLFYSSVQQLVLGSELLQATAPELHFLSLPAIALVMLATLAVGVGGSYFAVRGVEGR